MFSEKEIVEGCKKGKKRFQNLLYDKYAALLLGVCIRYIKNKMEAEDVLHDAFIKIYINIKKFEHKNEGSLYSWAKRITVNTALNYLRDNLKHAFYVDINDDFLESDIANDEEQISYPDIEPAEILKIVETMPNGYRLVFNMYVIEKYSHQEIADSLGISVSTSKTQLLKSKKYLKEKLSIQFMESNSII